jgi:hypothetical protein
MKKYYVLKGSFSAVYFNDRSKGTWKEINWLQYIWYYLCGKVVKINKRGKK